MGCPLEAFFLGVISTQLLWKGVIPEKVEGYYLKAPDHVLVEEGLCAMIPCNFTYNKQHALDTEELKGFWKKEENNQVKIVATSPQISAENRFQLIGDLTAGNCSLLILNAQESDEGNYFFRMEKNPEAKYNFFRFAKPYLNVTKGQLPEIQILGMLRVGYSTKVTCATFASCSWMPPKFTWNGLPRRMESPLQLNGTQVYSVVDFLPSVADHKQNITCRVNYTNGNNSVSRETTIQLNVTFKPQILIRGEHFCSNKSQQHFRNISQLKVQKGDCIRLRCKVKGNPLPQVTWVNGTKVLKTKPKALNVLELPDLKVEDAGKYTCQAANELGSVEASLELSVTDPIEILLLKVTGALVVLVVLMIITGVILASKRYWQKKKKTDSKTGNTVTNVKKPSPSDLTAQEVNGVPSKLRSTYESVDGDPRDPEEIHYATLTFSTQNPKQDITAEETQTDYAEIRHFNSRGKEAQTF